MAKEESGVPVPMVEKTTGTTLAVGLEAHGTIAANGMPRASTGVLGRMKAGGMSGLAGVARATGPRIWTTSCIGKNTADLVDQAERMVPMAAVTRPWA